MRVFLFLKVSFLMATLIGVFYVIRTINGDSMGRFLAAVGVQDNSSGRPTRTMSAASDTPVEFQSFSLCPNRIQGFVWPDGRRLEEAKDGAKVRWLVFEPKAREVASLEVEKWLGQHCQVKIRPILRATLQKFNFDRAFLVRYLDHSEAKLERSGSNVFRVGEQLFRSEDLSSAIDELEQIAKFKKPDQAP